MTRATLTRARGPWVGRGPQLHALQRAQAEAESGRPQVVIVGGEAGIGKSRLVAEFAAGLEQRARVVVGHCLELGPDGPPFAPFAAILRGLVAELGAQRVADLAGPGRVDLAVLAAEIGRGQRDDVLGQGRLFEAMATLLERVAAEQPLVVVVEDLHWSDASTRDLLRFLMRTVDDVALLVLLTYRRDELVRTHPLRPWLVEVDRLPHASRISLDPLSDSEVDNLIAALGGSAAAEATERIRQRSQGIPFFVEELTACADRGSPVIPETLRELMLTRLDRLAPESRDVVRTASAAGTQVDHAVLLALMDNDEVALDQALRDAVGAQVLVVGADQEGYTFRHALMREAVHADLLPGEHARLHARYARALEKLARPEQAGEIAHHWTSAHELDRAFEWSLRAADLARGRYAWREQQTHLERALDLWDHVDTPEERAGFDRITLLARTGRAAMTVGLVDRGVALLDLAVTAAEQEGGTDRLVHLLVTRARYCWEIQADPTEDLDRAMALAAPGSRDLAAALGARATHLMLLGRMHEALGMAEQALAATEAGRHDEQLSHAHNTLGCILFQVGRPAEGQHHLDRCLELAIGSDNLGDLVRYYGNYSDVLIGRGRFGEATAVARAGRDAAAQRGLSRTAGAFLAGNEAEAQMLAGLWPDVLAAVDAALSMDPPPVTRGHLGTLQGLVLVRRGQLAQAQQSATRAEHELTSARQQPQHMLPLAVLRAELARGRGDLAGAAAELAAVAAPLSVEVPSSAGWPFVWAWGRALLDLQAATPEAPPVPPPQLVAMRSWLLRMCPHPGWHALTEAQASALRAEPAADRVLAWTDAAERAAQGEGLLFEQADALVRLAGALIDQGADDGVRQALDGAWELIARLGAESLVPAATQAARSARLPVPRTPRLAGVGEEGQRAPLTPREREVVALVAAGRSNRQIAEELFISVKTASVHVSNILAKLDLSSRTQAAAWVHEHGAGSDL